MTKNLPMPAVLSDIRSLIDRAKGRVARTINQEMTLLYWHIGKRIQEEVLKFERAAYGKEVIRSLSTSLTMEYGPGFTNTALVRMTQFYESFRGQTIVATLSQQLTWSHFVELFPIEDDLKISFYAEMSRLENWSVRTLREKNR